MCGVENSVFLSGSKKNDQRTNSDEHSTLWLGLGNALSKKWKEEMTNLTLLSSFGYAVGFIAVLIMVVATDTKLSTNLMAFSRIDWTDSTLSTNESIIF